MVKVLIITPVFPPNVAVGGGVAITYGALQKRLEEMGHVVKVLSPRLDNLDFGSSLLYPNFPVIEPTWANFAQMCRHMAEADVVVCPDDCQLLFEEFFAAALAKPLLFNVHTNVQSLLEQSDKWVLRNVAAPSVGNFVRVVSHLSSKTYTTSLDYRDLLVKTGHRVDGVFSPRIKMAIFALHDDDEAIERAREWLTGGRKRTSRPLLIYAGRWSHEKRIELLVDALPESCDLAIVGDGPKPEYLLKRHNPERGVFVHKGMKDQNTLRTLYKASDALVSASHFETLGCIVLESIICGTPVLVQDAPGFRTQVVEGENGFFINYDKPEEAKKQLLERLAMLPTKAQLAATLVNRWDKDLENLEDVVVDLAKRGREPMHPLILAFLSVVMFFYYVFYLMMTFPFNKLTHRNAPPVFRLSTPAMPKMIKKSMLHWGTWAAAAGGLYFSIGGAVAN